MGSKGKRLGLLAAALLAAGSLLGGTAQAQTDESLHYRGAEPLEGPEWESPISPFYFSFGMDIVSAYYFRGYELLNSGGIFQPWLEVGVTAFEGDDWLNSIDVSVGWWNVATTSINRNVDGTSNWYETDIYFALEVGLFDYWTLGFEFTDYEYPGGGAFAIREVAWSVSFDDSEFLGPFALQPYAYYALEIDVTGGGEASYLEFGIAPGFTLLESMAYPIDVTFPIAIGLGFDGYYADRRGNDELFGYVTVGGELSMPLSFIPSDFGAWSVHAGVYGVFQNESAIMRRGNRTGAPEVWGLIGFAMEY